MLVIPTSDVSSRYSYYLVLYVDGMFMKSSSVNFGDLTNQIITPINNLAEDL